MDLLGFDVKRFDELVFKVRNKDYGAYDLRRKYNRTVTIASIIAFLIMTLAIGIPYLLAKIEEGKKVIENTVVAEMSDMKAPEEAPPPPPPPPPPEEIVQQVKYVAPTVVDTVVEDKKEMASIEDVKATTTNVAPQEDVMVVQKEQVVEEAAEVFTIVEEMPMFPGGDDSLRKYIAKSVKYPEVARENGIQGRVYVQFVVNGKGKVEQVKVVRGVDPTLDKEAIRIIESLPGWQPGKQRGKPVKVSFTVPINFKLS
ncbi:MAG: TonB family protein [Bacteroidia bacterium]|nr:TonB family protein [Bacteroidia bacterium]